MGIFLDRLIFSYIGISNIKLEEDRLFTLKIRYCQPILANCRIDITIFILYMGLYWLELVGAS
jgi:hypothetical protein